MKKNSARVEALRRTAARSVSDEDLAAVSGGISLAYGPIERTYAPQKPDGSLNVTFKYDLVKAKGA